jgi:electron transfer flavoprotein beta subunit
MSGMKLLVCVKCIADPNIIKYDFHQRELTSFSWTINWYDIEAIKEAMFLKSKLNATVTAVTIGPPEAETVLKTAFVRGVDKCYRIWDPLLETAGYLDSWQKANIMAHFIQRDQYQVILCGTRSQDWDSKWFGASLSQQLGLPFVSKVVVVEVQPDRITLVVHRKMRGRWRESYRVRLPAVIAVEESRNEPMYIAPSKLKVDVLSLSDLGCEEQGPLVEVLGITEVRPRTKALTDPSKLSFADRMRLVSGTLGEKKAQVFEGPAPDGARKIWQWLKELTKEIK